MITAQDLPRTRSFVFIVVNHVFIRFEDTGYLWFTPVDRKKRGNIMVLDECISQTMEECHSTKTMAFD